MHTTKMVKQNLQYGCLSLFTILFFRIAVITILKVVGSENCARKDKLPLWGLGVKPLVAWQFSEKIAILMTFRTFLEQLEKAKLRRFGRV